MFTVPLNSRTFPKAITENSDKRPAAAFFAKAAAVVRMSTLRATPHNSKCRYGERGAAAAKPKAQIILDVLSSILATQMPCRTPSRSEALRSVTAACGGSWRGDPPKRCLSRKAGIVRCCLIPAAACAVPLPSRPKRRPRRRSAPRLCRSRRQHRCRAGRSFWHPAHHARGRRP